MARDSSPEWIDAIVGGPDSTPAHARRDARPMGPLPTQQADRPWWAKFVLALDDWLRQFEGVFEYSQSPDCLFRINVERLRADVRLADGTFGARGDRAIEIHLWNEHVPRIPPSGVSLAWARRFNRQFGGSLSELARFLEHRPDLRDVAIIQAQMSIGSHAQYDALLAIVMHHGFEVAADLAGRSPAALLHRFGQNVLCLLLTLAANPAAARLDTFWRSHSTIFLSRRTLEQMHSGKPDIIASDRA
jgi:hypothetical protein